MEYVTNVTMYVAYILYYYITSHTNKTTRESDGYDKVNMQEHLTYLQNAA